MSHAAGEIFARLAAEAGLIEEGAAAIEAALTPDAPGDADFTRLQDFDRLRQHIAALRWVLERLCDAAAAGAALDLHAASEFVTLGEVQSRLRGGEAPPAARGALDLFEK